MSTEYPKSQRGDPTWELASLFPQQGFWTEQEYLRLDAGRLVEFEDGKLEMIAMPSELHQFIAIYLMLQIRGFVDPKQLGVCCMAPLRVQVREGKYREPDVLFMLSENRHRRTPKFWYGADLVMEVVSDDDPDRDLVDKREDYARVGIPEYWIIDPRDSSILLLTLDQASNQYREQGRFTGEDVVASKLLDGFKLRTSEVFDRPEAVV